MARPLSAEKRAAILAAAVTQFAKRGVWSTPTAAIADAAGVAGGTLFTYFASKDDLVNSVYHSLTHELADSLQSAYPVAADSRIRFRHLWDRYVDWGTSHPERFAVLAQLQASSALSRESHAIGSVALKEIERLAKDGIRRKRIRNHPLPYLAAIMAALAGTTIACINRQANKRVDHAAAGFEIFWAGIAT